MASYAAAQAVPENLPGDFSATEHGIDCDLCRPTAAQFFARHHRGNIGYAYVYQQPRSTVELRACREAVPGCPLEAFAYKLI